MLRDQSGRELDVTALTDDEKLAAILHWSALPGSSRHHWGTDLDVYDPTEFTNTDRQLQLVPSEYCDPQGPCFSLWQWLTEHASEFGFFFPYARYQGGVAQEPWHLSYQPLASVYLQQLSLSVLETAILHSSLAARETICAMLPALYQRYICNIDGEDNV